MLSIRQALLPRSALFLSFGCPDDEAKGHSLATPVLFHTGPGNDAAATIIILRYVTSTRRKKIFFA